MKKRAQAGIITTILIVLIVVVAVVIVWNVVKNVVTEKSGEIELDILSVNFKISSVYVNYLEGKLQFAVERGSDNANISSIKIIVYGKDISDNEITKDYNIFNVPAPLETKVINYLAIGDFKAVTKFAVYPVSDKGKPGISVVYNIKTTEPSAPAGGWQGGTVINPGNNNSIPPSQIDCYGDRDGDGYWNGTSITVSGSCPSGWNSVKLSEAIDCDDSNATIWQNLQGYVDADKDNYGIITGNPQTICTGSAPPEGYSTNNLDCNDTNSAVNPGVSENASNEIDDNCDGIYGLDHCEWLDSPGATYILTQNIIASGTCLTIYADRITLDLNGFNVIGNKSGSLGVYLYSYIANSSTIKNGGIYGFANTGIYSVGNSNINITNITANNNIYGIFLYSNSNNTLTDITANNNSYTGIYLTSSSNKNILTGITANNNTNYGVYLGSNSNNNQLTGITANSNTGTGIYLTSSSNNTLKSITANSNSYIGINLYSSSNNTLTGVTANNNNNNYGIYLQGGSNNTLNLVTANNNNYGIILKIISNNQLTDITANNNNYGIYLQGSSNNNITKSTACSNIKEDFDCFASTDNFGTGNIFGSNVIICGDGWPQTPADYSPCLP